MPIPRSWGLSKCRAGRRGGCFLRLSSAFRPAPVYVGGVSATRRRGRRIPTWANQAAGFGVELNEGSLESFRQLVDRALLLPGVGVVERVPVADLLDHSFSFFNGLLLEGSHTLLHLLEQCFV